MVLLPSSFGRGGGTKPGLNIKDKDVKKEKEEKTKVGTGLVIILKASLT